MALNKAWDLVSISAYRAFDSLDTVDTDFSDADLSATNDASSSRFLKKLDYYTSEDARFNRCLLLQPKLRSNLDTTTQDDFSAFFNAAAPDLLPWLTPSTSYLQLHQALLRLLQHQCHPYCFRAQRLSRAR